MPDVKKVDLIKKNEMGIIVIQNPTYNTLSTEVFQRLKAALENLKNDPAIKVVIITGKGLFSAGAEVKEIWQIAKNNDLVKGKELLDMANSVPDLIESLGKPVVAAIDGFCLGGGNEMAMACAARIATDQAKFGQPEINLGIMPGMGGTQRLSRLINLEKALIMLILGNIISAKEAKELGLVDEVVSQKELITKTKEFVAKILEKPIERKFAQFNLSEFEAIVATEKFQALMKTKSPDAVQAILKAVKEGMPMPLAEALKLEQQLFADLVMTDGAKKAIAKFLKIEDQPKEQLKTAPTPTETGISRQEYDILRKTLRDFAKKEIEPKIEEMEKEEKILPEIMKKMAELGFYGISYPEKYGGAGFGKTGYCMIFEELSRVHASTAVVVGAHIGLACGAIYLFGNETQKQKYLRAGIDGKMMGAFALTESEAGSDAANIQTTAVKKDNKWVINGTKQFITNADFADFIIVIAQTDSFLGLKGLAGFIVETKWPGFSVVGLEHKMGIRASRTAQIAFDNIEVPEENMLGQIGDGFKIAMNTLNGGRLGLAAGCLGASKAAFEIAYKHAAQRVQFGKTLVEQEAIQFYLAEMRAKIHMMQAAIYDAAKRADKGEDVRLEAAILKLMCSEYCCEIIDTSLQILGGYGYMEDYPLARMYRDARINRIFEGTNEIQKLMIFKEIFKSGGKID